MSNDTGSNNAKIAYDANGEPIPNNRLFLYYTPEHQLNIFGNDICCDELRLLYGGALETIIMLGREIKILAAAYKGDAFADLFIEEALLIAEYDG